eukprot:6916149-Prymnesium_polylepis.1
MAARDSHRQTHQCPTCLAVRTAPIRADLDLAASRALLLHAATRWTSRDSIYPPAHGFAPPRLASQRVPVTDCCSLRSAVAVSWPP